MRKYDFINMLEYIQKYRITNLTLVPPIVVQLTKREEVSKYDLTSLEGVGCGAAPLGKETIAEFERRFTARVEIRQGWGMVSVIDGRSPARFIKFSPSFSVQLRTAYHGLVKIKCENRLTILLLDRSDLLSSNMGP